ncbi:hypothetical protein FHP88_15635 [Sedimenticola selenatireducens]|uniref:Lipoprotein n=1 Tax=Sedimenticola selenatireducens TaxID=191960 RepID=A0A557S0E4_9GAMM|nr:hypothetical protein [Sedimenticola selenatireducens]TVO70884.1 hypothetical protein FHP88_15635 [Sedimenticola selenatireducens]
MRRSLLLFVFMALALVGCGNDTLVRGENDQALGTHKYSVKPDGTVSIDTRSLRGAPDVEIHRPDGTTVHIRSSDVQKQLGKLFMQSLN